MIAFSTGALTGTFGSIDSFINGVTFSAIYDQHDVRLVVDSVAAVPVPSALWLFGSSLIGFCAMSRRRRQCSQVMMS
jgi:hypothetical protein